LPRSRVPFLAFTSFACFILPDFSLLTRFFRISAEKEQLTTAHREMKEHAMDAELRHARKLQKAKATAEAKLDETLKEYTDSTAGLRKELEEEAAARKAAQDKIAQLTADQADYDQMVMQINALACSK
jgi:septal ring factor EnvC (AmiA/AmiB activator)